MGHAPSMDLVDGVGGQFDNKAKRRESAGAIVLVLLQSANELWWFIIRLFRDKHVRTRGCTIQLTTGIFKPLE